MSFAKTKIVQIVKIRIFVDLDNQNILSQQKFC